MSEIILSTQTLKRLKSLNGNGSSLLSDDNGLKVTNGKSNILNRIKNVRKRDGRIVGFNITKIVNAAYKAMSATKEGSEAEAIKVAKAVYIDLLTEAKDEKSFIPDVEHVQDLVEKALILEGLVQTAKAYILYRKEHQELRLKSVSISPEVQKMFDESKKCFKSSLSELVFYRSYSRWIEGEGRRETWIETVKRFVDFMKEVLGKKLSENEYNEVHTAILKQEVIPSMRLFWAAGTAARATNVAAYNCSFVAPTRWRDFAEILYIQMCGAGVGFSAESQTVQQLPQIKKQAGKVKPKHVVGDSREGWAEALRIGLETWSRGYDINFDYSKIRLQGARLKTMGGRASGPAPLRDLLEFVRSKIFSKQGKRLSNLDVHDIVCKTGEIVVAGGVRRSSLISLSDLDDNEMRFAKNGQFYLTHPQRSMANNSAVYNEKPTTAEFLDEWIALAKSGSGERGIFNRGGLRFQMPKRRVKASEKYLETMGTNPCGEINLRSREFCNLSSIVIRESDKNEDFLRKIRLASMLGTYQATLTDFPYLSPQWKKNCQEESLLGVSLTGYWDNKAARSAKTLREMRDLAVQVNKKYAKRFGINPSAAVTCIKPSGNSSQLLDTASGMHPRWSKFYIRRIRINSSDPLLKMLRDQGVPAYPEVGQTEENATTFVLEFPVAAPKGAIVKDDISAIELLENWKLLKTNFTEHNPSATIYVGDDEWIGVANWIYKNWDIVGGLSFLPRNNHVYQLAPYEEIEEAKYKELYKKVGSIDFSKMVLYERDDQGEGSKEAACVGGACEV
ncbi:ribonucleoside-triphosphate reductase [Candidatus Woesebacteria bacterium]|nr:ribonucleoside-triphosphate reductase [Candidatus Woesebacteria bacterium]